MQERLEVDKNDLVEESEESEEESDNNRKYRFKVIKGAEVELEEGEILDNKPIVTSDITNKMTTSTPPPLVFKDNNKTIENPNSLNFPNAFHLLQCFTLRAASDAFDLER